VNKYLQVCGLVNRYSICTDYGVAFRDVVQTLVQSLESLENDTGAEPTSMKYQAALADQVPYCSLQHYNFCAAKEPSQNPIAGV